MAAGYWDVDLFTAELMQSLEETFAGPSKAEALHVGVAKAAAAAEAVCGDRPMACGPGCPSCCVLNVAVLLPEAMLIAEWLQQQLSGEAMVSLHARLTDHCLRVRWMDDEARIFAGVRCVLLDAAGNCSIHPVRPLVCRGAASLNRDSCLEAFRPWRIDQERQVPADLLRLAAHDASFKALGAILRRWGLDARSIELGAGILAFLEHPPRRDQYLSGEGLPLQLWE